MSSRKSIRMKTEFLVKVLNFSIVSKALPNKDILATLENAVKRRRLTKEEADKIYAKMKLTLQNSKSPKGGWRGRKGTGNIEIPTIFPPKYRFTVRFFTKYRYRNSFSYFIVSLPRLAQSTPTKSYQNK